MKKQLTICRECGVSQTGRMTCWDQFCAVLNWEWQNPELQAKHFLTVSSYNLQHPSKFTDDAIDGLREIFKDHIENGLPIRAIRKQVSHAAAGNRAVLKKKEAGNQVLREWKMTIADVFLSNQPDGAAERVQKWAESILEDLQDH